MCLSESQSRRGVRKHFHKVIKDAAWMLGMLFSLHKGAKQRGRREVAVVFITYSGVEKCCQETHVCECGGKRTPADLRGMKSEDDPPGLPSAGHLSTILQVAIYLPSIFVGFEHFWPPVVNKEDSIGPFTVLNCHLNPHHISTPSLGDQKAPRWRNGKANLFLDLSKNELTFGRRNKQVEEARFQSSVKHQFIYGEQNNLFPPT